MCVNLHYFLFKFDKYVGLFKSNALQSPVACNTPETICLAFLKKSFIRKGQKNRMGNFLGITVLITGH